MVDQPEQTPADAPWEGWFVANMQTLRERRGLSQTELAKLLKAKGLPFHQQTIQRIESNERPVRLNEAYAISAVLDSTVEAMTYSRMPSSKSLSVSMQYLLDKGLDIADLISVDGYGEWIAPVAFVFSYDLDVQLSREDRENKHDFGTLPEYLKLAVAFAAQLVDATMQLAVGINRMGKFIKGSDWGTEKYDYEVTDPEFRLQGLIRIITKYDCDELRELAKLPASTLHTKAAKASGMNIIKAPNSGTHSSPTYFEATGHQ